MSIKLTCPACGCSGDDELFGADKEWRHAMVDALAMPSNCGPGVKEYLNLFRPIKRALSAKRARKLLAEVRELICADEITFDRACYKIPAHVWQQALQIMIEKIDLQRPMPNHNYLIKVAISLLVKRVDMQQQEQHQARRSEARVDSEQMQPFGEALNKTVVTTLPTDPKLYRTLYQQASAELEEEGFHKNLIIKPFVESRMVELTRQAL
ncbi:MAG: hypothetical protein R8M38_01650 [Mariprofundaceae bacterium]